jgi:hypothetical protein
MVGQTSLVCVALKTFDRRRGGDYYALRSTSEMVTAAVAVGFLPNKVGDENQ